MIPALLAQLTPAATPEPLPIRDIAPPVDIPWPPWLIACAVIGGVLALAGIVTFIIWWMKKWPTAPPPTPRQLAKRALEKLRSQVATMAPYEFSIAVSDVLRSYLGAEFGMHAQQQTSPEFLAEVSQSGKFNQTFHAALTEFLEHADLIKFARIDATSEDSTRLLESALRFVEGGPA